jgi:hypothetical protein
MDRRTGGCLCGAVRFSATVTQADFAVCHCDMCRRWGSGPFFALSAKDVAFEDPGAVRRHRSSPWAERGFCGVCGSSLFFRLVNGGGDAGYELSVGTLDDQSGLRVTGEIFTDRNPGAYALAGPLTALTEAESIARFATDTGLD